MNTGQETHRADQPILYAENKFTNARAAFNNLFLLLYNFQDHEELAPLQIRIFIVITRKELGERAPIWRLGASSIFVVETAGGLARLPFRRAKALGAQRFENAQSFLDAAPDIYVANNQVTHLAIGSDDESSS